MFWRCDCRAERVRWADGGRGVRRARAPVMVVMRIGEGGAEESVELGWGGEGRRVRVEGYWDVWKVVWWKRRWPERVLGSEVFD